jgi:hypothetical protein
MQLPASSLLGRIAGYSDEAAQSAWEHRPNAEAVIDAALKSMKALLQEELTAHLTSCPPTAIRLDRRLGQCYQSNIGHVD